MGDDLILDATLSTSNASAAAIWRIRDSSVERGRTFPYTARVGFDVSLAIDRMAEYADTVGSRVRAIDPHAFAIVFGHAGDGNLHLSVHHEHTPASTISSRSSSMTSLANSAARFRPNTVSAS